MLYDYEIVILDKDDSMSEFIANTLVENGIIALSIKNKDREKVPLFLNQKPSKIIVFDNNLYYNDYEFSQKLRDNCKKSFIIFAMDENITEMEEDMIRKYPVNMFVKKPYSIYEIISLLKK